MDPLTMFVIVRKDLCKSLNWSTGSIIAQACHACTLALVRYEHHPDTKAYLMEENQSHLHKVIYEVKHLAHLERIAERLQEHAIDHVVWTELPENLNTAIATRPYKRSDFPKNLFKSCSLYR